MNPFNQELAKRLATIREQGLLRELRPVDSPQGVHIKIKGRDFLNFSSNDYLGLANHPSLKKAAVQAVEKYGAGSGAARLICGSLAPHHELEETLAAWKGTEAALCFSTGYATAVGVISALVDKNNIIIIDKLVHASIVDAARLSGAKLRIFAHNDLEDLESILKWAAKQPSKPQALIVTESVFSMDGDQAPLQQIVALKEKYGAWLMLDEAHATGLFGKNRCGLAEELGVANHVEVQMGTLGKALGTSGGYICGSRVLIDYLINRARSFIFSTAPMPATAAASTASISLVQSKEGETRRQKLWRNIKEIQTAIPSVEECKSAIIPIIIGDESEAIAAAAKLRDLGIFIPAVRFPTVARGQARLRLTATAAHKTEDIQRLANALAQIRNPQSAI